MFNILFQLTPALSRVLVTSIVLGFLAGSFGVFIVLKKQALVGDTIAHSALPGVVLTFILFNSKELEILLIGAIFTGFISILLFNFIKKHSKIKNDATLAILLAGFFGLGRMMLSVVQSSNNAGASGLESFIFGQAATILLKDMFLTIVVAVVVNIVITLLWKELKIQIFNPEYFNSIGFNSRLVDIIFSVLIVLVVVAGIQMVGVVLISAMLIAPAVAARQWSHRLCINYLLAGLIGSLSGLAGVLLADHYNLPPGPMIIVVLTSVTLLSLLFSKNGVVIKTIKQIRYRYYLKKYAELVRFYHDEELTKEELQQLLEKNYLIFDDNKYQMSKLGCEKVNLIIGDEDD
ncbi:MAG TPA: metal ABC transporter permease [Acholeplasmataceae bacterium]|jgi:manganese/zinc/iron transport system permease protein|nr:metal ABC transporter permease [Acholeplasmataceae bacterium]